MSKTGHAKVVIIGSGPGRFTAAIYAARAMLEPVLIQGVQPGGQLTVTTDVENYPGFADVIQGPWLMEQMAAQAEHVGTRLVYDHVNAVDFSPAVPLPLRFRRLLHRRRGDHRDRRAGALARARIRAGVTRPRRLRLRHLRRLFLREQARRRDRRRQHCGRGSALPRQFRQRGEGGSIAVTLSRRQTHSQRPGVRAPEDRGDLGSRGRGGRSPAHPRRSRGWVPQRQDRRPFDRRRRRRVHRHRPHAGDRTVHRSGRR